MTRMSNEYFTLVVTWVVEVLIEFIKDGLGLYDYLGSVEFCSDCSV